MIAIVDYGAGNLASVRGAVEIAVGRSGRDVPVRVTSDPDEVAAAAAVVLPGVGAFGDGARQLRRSGLDEAIAAAIGQGKPFVGICLGLQLLFEESEESPGIPGLALLPGRVRRFGSGIKVPHMGWNQVWRRQACRALEGVPEGAFLYFVHSYFVAPEDVKVIATETDYGEHFCSSVAFGTVFACQFHPEKSQHHGLRILENLMRAALDVGHTGD